MIMIMIMIIITVIIIITTTIIIIITTTIIIIIIIIIQYWAAWQSIYSFSNIGTENVYFSAPDVAFVSECQREVNLDRQDCV